MSSVVGIPARSRFLRLAFWKGSDYIKTMQGAPDEQENRSRCLGSLAMGLQASALGLASFTDHSSLVANHWSLVTNH